jgi:hypothetical protein
MSFLTKITLTSPGSSTGPFDIYQSSDSYTTAIATDVAKGVLVDGYTISVNDVTTSVLVQSKGLCSSSNIILTISGVLTPTPTPTQTVTPTPSHVPAGVSAISLSSGHTVASACTGTTRNYYYNGSFINGAQLWLDAGLNTDVAPGTNAQTVFYYSYDFNSIYYINDSEGHKYTSTQVCPTPTPVLNENKYWVSLVDGPTAAACGGDIDMFGVGQLTGFTVYGSALYGICDATMIVDMPAIVKSEVPFNGTFWVGKKYGGNFYYRKYVRNSSGTASLPDGACVIYNNPCN